MSYSGAGQAKQARELLGNALAVLQQDATVPPQVGAIVSYMAQAVGSLFAAEYAQNNADGRAAVRAALGLLGQAIAAIQQIQHPSVQAATGALAQAMGLLFPLTTVPDTLQPEPAPFLAQAPVAPVAPVPTPVAAPVAAPVPAPAQAPVAAPVPAPAQAPVATPEPAKPVAKQTLLMATLPTQTELQALHKGAAEPAAAPAARHPEPTPHGFDTVQQAPQAQPTPTPAHASFQPAPTPAHATFQPAPTPAHATFQPAPASFQAALENLEPAPAAAPAEFQPAPAPAPAPAGFQPAPASFQAALASFQPTPAALAPSPPPTQDSFTAAATVPAPQGMAAMHAAPQALAAQARPAESPQPAPRAQPAQSRFETVATPAQAPTPAMSPDQIRAANAAISAAQNDGRKTLEANVGMTTEANFWVGFDDDIAHGGVFVPTYEPLPEGTRVMLQVTLPAGGMFACPAHVRYVRDSLEYTSEMQPGMGLQFDALLPEHRDLAQRFMQKRRALFFDEA